MATTTVKLYSLTGELTSISGVDRSKVDDPPPKILRYQDKFYTFTGLAENSRPVFHQCEPTDI